MECRTISDNFRERIEARQRVVAAVFTTYNFEPDFFEQEVIPLMLDQDVPYSADARIKRIQVREALGQAGLPIEVFYDLDMFRQQQPVSPAMEYLHHGIRGERSAFHAKLVFLLLEDCESGERVLQIGAGSANLTNAGWWENIECQHWERVAGGEVSRRFLGQLRSDIDWLADRRRMVGEAPGSALTLVRSFLAECRASNTAETVSYYGLRGTDLRQARRPAFMKFLMDAQGEQCSYYNHWSLEIISPYFADRADFNGHEFFFNDLKVDQIRIFLPTNDQGEALCRKDYYERMAKDDRIEWASWAPDIGKTLGIGQVPKRKTHAKIYHFYNGQQSWAFIGSVNFTHRATADNQEAGFFIKLPTGTTLLMSLKSPPDTWCAEEDLPAAEAGAEADRALPVILLSYDWKERVLTAGVQGEQAIVIDVLTPERRAVLRDVVASPTVRAVPCEPAALEEILRKSGFVWVPGSWEANGASFAEHAVLVQQTNWTHKPLDLPNLTPQEIMQIYAGLSPLRRNQVIEHLKERELRELGLAGEMAGSTGYEDQGRQFFAEYAELFHAFRNLRRQLTGYFQAGQLNQLDYYLSGRGMDSLPTLLSSLYEKDRNLEAVTIYLALLCLIQIYRYPDYAGRSQVADLLAECTAKLDAIEESGELQLVDADPERSARFFRWYREQFFREYRHEQGEAQHAAD